ncbi:MAG TPA: DUF3313 family protein [Steroidobacteraceae bacterium]|jgi:hypothetical protein|nr:DUF3313 family protein [Steroidobacteraceae bacterium]
MMSGLCAALTLAAPGASWAKDPPPRVSPDGLELKKETDTRLVYLKPDVKLSQYQRVAILDCYVEFSKDWLRDYNNSQRDPSRKIKDSDIQRAKTNLSAQFKKVFTDELQAKGGYQVTDTAAPDVLALRPALINIQVSAPDLMAPGRSVTYVQSGGQMTLYLELWDSAKNTILARVMDAQADTQTFTQRSSSVTNQAVAERLLRSWAVELRSALDAARGQP